MSGRSQVAEMLVVEVTLDTDRLIIELCMGQTNKVLDIQPLEEGIFYSEALQNSM